MQLFEIFEVLKPAQLPPLELKYPSAPPGKPNRYGFIK
jgi:hypothetical protein